MKRIAIVAFCALGGLSAFAEQMEVTPDFLEGTYLCVSALPQYQIPIPWDAYDNNVQTWGDKNVTGVAVDLIYGENRSVAGLGVGLVTRALDYCAGVQLGIVPMANEGYGWQFGLFNRARLFRGFQLGVVNWSDDLLGVQLGLVNVISESPLVFFPVINMRF